MAGGLEGAVTSLKPIGLSLTKKTGAKFSKGSGFLRLATVVGFGNFGIFGANACFANAGLFSMFSIVPRGYFLDTIKLFDTPDSAPCTPL